MGSDKVSDAKSSPARTPDSGGLLPLTTKRFGAVGGASREGEEDDFEQFLDEIDGGAGAKGKSTYPLESCVDMCCLVKRGQTPFLFLLSPRLTGETNHSTVAWE